MRRILAVLSLLSLVAVPSGAAAQSPADVEARIRNALSAAPMSVADAAMVMDHDGTVLREGTNGWLCMPDVPDAPNSPACVDEPWRELMAAWQERRDPRISGIGIAYMLQGDMPVSNIDPFAEGPAEGNQWIAAGPPHIMVVIPDAALLEGLPTDPDNGGPWVMWKGTPYAHIMIPTVPRER